MKLPRRQFLHLAAGAAALPAVSHVAWAQPYPTRPVRLVVGFPPGGVADLYARLIGQWLPERLGQAFIIENRAGAGGNLAAEAVVKAPPDGYTLLMVGANNAWNATLYDNLNFNFIRDIAPIGSIYRAPAVLVVHPSFPTKSVPELIAYAKANPGKINMASGGVGSAQHVYGELFKMCPVWTCSMCRIAAVGQRLPTSSPGKCRSCSTRWLRQSSTSGRANCALLR